MSLCRKVISSSVVVLVTIGLVGCDLSEKHPEAPGKSHPPIIQTEARS